VFYLILDKVIADDTIPGFISRAAKDLVYRGYLTTGEFFDKLSKDELTLLNTMISSVKTLDYKDFLVETEEDQKTLLHLITLCFILALGEGMPEASPDMMTSMLPSLTSLATAETMHRNGVGNAIRKNFSLFERNLEVFRMKT
jgi:hypothetical protein